MVLACRKILLPVVLFLRKNIKISHSDNNPTLPMATTMSAYQIHYTFTGKEKDTETGYHYFGARYYSSDLSIWLSVDPMRDKYPSLSPYNYCAWNPMKLVDPDGREIDDYFSKSGKYLGSDDASTRNVRIIDEKLWNSLDKDEKGHVQHDLANSISTSFSQASSQSMSESEQLSVYQHYNITEYNIKTALDNEKGSSNPGMITISSTSGNDVVVIKCIAIKLQENRTINRTGVALCDNAYEIISCFVHERNHIRRALKMGYRAWRGANNTFKGKRDIEASAIKSQREHSSWQGCSTFFKEGIDNYEKKF